MVHPAAHALGLNVERFPKRHAIPVAMPLRLLSASVDLVQIITEPTNVVVSKSLNCAS